MVVKPGYKQTEVGVIPEDWSATTLVTLTSDIGDGIHATPVYSSAGEYYFINGNNLRYGRIVLTEDTKTVCYSEFKKHRKDLSDRSILMSINGTIGNLGLFTGESVILGKSAAYLNVKPNVAKMFVYYSIQTEIVKRQFTDGLTGTTIGNLGLSTIRNSQVPLPPTKAEQEAIAGALSDADVLIESMEQLITKKRQVKQGAMQELLTGKKRLPGFSGEWETKRLGNTAGLKARIGWQGLTTAEYLESGDYYLVTGTEFKDGFIDWDNCHCVVESRYKQDKNIQLKEHDILVTKDGTIGKVALITHLDKPATLNSGVFVIRPLEKSFYPDFFYYLLCSNFFKIFLDQLSAGSTINHLYQKDFVSFIYKTPATIAEQEAIAAVLSDMDSEIAALGDKLTKARQLKQGMMQELLTGRIRLI